METTTTASSSVIEKTKAALRAKGIIDDSGKYVETMDSGRSSTSETSNISLDTMETKAESSEIKQTDLEGATKTSEASNSKRKFKFLDEEEDEEIEFELDVENEETLKDFAKKSHKASKLEVELKARQEEIAAKAKKLAEREKEINRLMKLREEGPEALLNELLKSEGGYEGVKAKWQEEAAKFADMSEAERTAFNMEREKAKLQKEIELHRKQVQAEKEEAAKRMRDAETAELRTMLKTAAAKHMFANEKNDPSTARKNDMIFESAKKELTRLEADGVKLTQEIINREMKKSAKLLFGDMRPKTTDKVAEVKENISKTHSEAQAISAGSGKPQTFTESDVVNRWVGMIREGKLREVSQEALKNPTLTAIYTKHGSYLAKAGKRA